MSYSDYRNAPASPKTAHEVEDALPAVGEKGRLEIGGPGEAPLVEAPKGWRKFLLVSLLCGAQLFDIFTACSAMAALPTIGEKLNFTPGELPWILTAYTLTFTAFQVPAGRLSDIYRPKPVFCFGLLAVGIFSILCAVSVNPIMLLVFRAMTGLAAALTVPTAISILVQTFTDPREKNQLLGIFGGSGAVGNCTGLIVGGAVSSQATWRWIYWVMAICIIPFALVATMVVPDDIQRGNKVKRSLDLPGVGILTAALILFVFAISDGNSEGWGSPQIITTLILSIVLFVVFFLVERYVQDPALPPSTWSNKNFAPMFVYAWSVYWFFFVVEAELVQIFQNIWHWSTLSSGVHCLPIGIASGTSAWLSGMYGHLVPRRVLLVAGQVLMIIGSILFALADEPSKYWSHIFTGLVIGMIGVSIAYVGSNITAMTGARKGEEGVVGAVLYTSYQLGSTLGIAVATAVTLGVNGSQTTQIKGYAASFWSLVAMHGIMTIIAIVFVHD